MIVQRFRLKIKRKKDILSVNDVLTMREIYKKI